MDVATCLLDKGAGVNLKSALLIHRSWRSRMKHKNMPKSRTATRKFIKLYELISHHLRIGDLCTRVWFDINPFLAVNINIGTRLIDRFTYAVCSVESKAMQRHSLPVAILTRRKRKKKTPTTQNVCCANTNDEHISDNEDSLCVRIARQVVSEPNTKH